MRINEIITEASVIKQMKRRRDAQKRPEPEGYWYRGYKCTKDCSGHMAGYFWSKRKNIKKAQNCPTQVHNSFREGCLSCVYNLYSPTRLPK